MSRAEIKLIEVLGFKNNLALKYFFKKHTSLINYLRDLNSRKGNLLDMKLSSCGNYRLKFRIVSTERQYVS